MILKSEATEEKISVYYDGLCHLCSREIDHYKKMRGSEGIQFVDIADPSFEAGRLGLDPVAINRFLHVRDKQGVLHTGVDAFVLIWSELSAMERIAQVAQLKPIHSVLEVLYEGFARLRPFLPRKSCEHSPYCETRPRE